MRSEKQTKSIDVRNWISWSYIKPSHWSRHRRIINPIGIEDLLESVRRWNPNFVGLAAEEVEALRMAFLILVHLVRLGCKRCAWHWQLERGIWSCCEVSVCLSVLNDQGIIITRTDSGI